MFSLLPITLVVVCDDHYVALVAALIKSIEDNLRPGGKIDLWIVDDGVGEMSKKKMNDSVDAEITTITWILINDAVKGAKLPIDRSSYPLNIYARLFIPYFLPPAVKKALYLDADMIVLSDLYNLFQTDISGYPLAAVTDPRVKTFDNHWGGILNYKALGLNGTSPYFNTGLLLINTTKWREEAITDKIVRVINEHVKFANYPDQYGLNIVMADRWLLLDDAWNNFVTVEHPNPYILHFVDRKPIYKAYKNSPQYQRIFLKYLHTTAWKNYQPIGEPKRYLKKIKNILVKFLKFIR